MHARLQDSKIMSFLTWPIYWWFCIVSCFSSFGDMTIRHSSVHPDDIYLGATYHRATFMSKQVIMHCYFSRRPGIGIYVQSGISTKWSEQKKHITRNKHTIDPKVKQKIPYNQRWSQKKHWNLGLLHLWHQDFSEEVSKITSFIGQHDFRGLSVRDGNSGAPGMPYPWRNANMNAEQQKRLGLSKVGPYQF